MPSLLRPAPRQAPTRARWTTWLRARRRGVAAVLAMMFLILFGSLSAAMAIASRGNITTAATHLHVSRAHAAAETGLAVAAARLTEAANQFLVSGSDVTATFGWDLWRGNTATLGSVTVLAPRTGRQDTSRPSGLAAGLAALHGLDQNTVASLGVTTPTIGSRLADAEESEGYYATEWVYTPAVALESVRPGSSQPPLAYAITYAPIRYPDPTDASRELFAVRAIVTGFDYAYSREGRGITRTIIQDFNLSKRVRHAIIAPSRIMLGKNVHVSGSLGARFDDITFNNGDPIVMRSDFSGLIPANKLNAFYTALAAHDVDGDNRLRARTGDPEAAGVEAANEALFGSGPRDETFTDVTRDGFIDEFDLYIHEFDADGDGRVSAAEAAADPDLFLLIDSSTPDRNRNGIFGFADLNRNGRLDGSEPFLDIDPTNNSNRDQILGYLDGYVDWRDQYAKVQGRLAFRVREPDWASARGAVDPKLRGTIRPNPGESPVAFGLDDNQLPEINPASFSTARTALQTAADGLTFAQQVASPTSIPGGPAPEAFPLQPDANGDDLPDNVATAYWERMPFNSPNYTDIYYRPVYRNIVFRDVQIPAGTNALFINCWFIGVTWVRSETANTHTLWNEYGKLRLNASGAPESAANRLRYAPPSTDFPASVPASARRPDGSVLMARPPMDQGDLTGADFAATPGASTTLPLPLIVGGRRITNTKELSNNIRFHDCLFVGSVVSDSPQGYTQVRNKIQFTGSTRFAASNPFDSGDAFNPEARDNAAIKTSSLMLPNYSVDLGTFNSPPDQDVNLNGAIIAGVMDIRGNASIDGALLLTFDPTLGAGPLRDALGNPIGNPANFNTTIGYFGPDDGDDESLDISALPVDAATGRRIVGWDTNGDGFLDVPGTAARPAGSTPVLFNGFGRVQIRFNPDLRLPDGIMLPMTFSPIPGTYREGAL